MIRAAIDLGTNSLRTIIAEVNPDKTITTHYEKTWLCRIGEKINETGLIQPEPMQRALEALSESADIFKKMKITNVTFVATSALRDAKNSDLFKASVKKLGLDMTIISGLEEARIIAKAVNFFLDEISNNSLFIDQGGGSIEFIHHTDKNETYQSLDVGIVRYSEMFFKSLPANAMQIKAFSDSFYNIVTSNTVAIIKAKPDQLVVIGGTGATLAKLFLNLDSFDTNLVHGTKVPYNFVVSFFDNIRTLNAKEISDFFSLDAKRADVVLAGTLQIMQLLEIFNLKEFVVSDRGLRYGLLL